MELFDKIKGQSVLLSNMMSLGIVQAANCLIPVLIIPFVTKALDVDVFGKAVFAQNVISYLTILVNFGFEYSATQDIAVNRNDLKKVNVIFWTVIRFKVILLLLSFFIMGILSFWFEKVEEDKILYFYAMLINVGFVFFPTWFFQGMEKMARMAVFNFVIKFLGAIFTVLLIRVPSDYRLYILILSLSYVLVGIGSFFYVLNHYNLWHIEKNKIESIVVIKKGFPIFINNVFVSFYNVIGLTVIGLYLSDIEIGLYSGAHKLISAIIFLSVAPISMSIFPKMSRMFNENRYEAISFFKKILLISLGLGFFIAIGVYFCSPILVDVLLGEEFVDSVLILRWMLFLPLLVLVATLMTVQGLYGLQLQKVVPFVGLFCGSVSLGLSFVLIPKIGVYGAIVAWCAAQFFEILIDGILLFRKIKC